MSVQSDDLNPIYRRLRGFFVSSGRLNAAPVILLALLGLVLAVATAVVLNRATDEPQFTLYLFLADLAYIILLFALMAWRIVALVGARRSMSAGAALHLRLTGIFAVVAVAPTIIVAVFATVSLYFGFEASFSERVRVTINSAEATAEAYAQEQRNSIQGDVLSLANDLNRAGARGASVDALTKFLRVRQRVSGFDEAYLINSAREIIVRGEFSYSFTYDAPTERQMTDARLGDLVAFDDPEANEIRALFYLSGLVDTFLYVSREYDERVQLIVQNAADGVAEYRRLEASRQSIILLFAMIYLGFAVLVITAAVWLGLWFAERLSRPIGVLAGAAQKVGEGDLDVRVPETSTGDEVALLGRVFNRMTAQVKGQRDALIEANRETEHRRNFIETVLSGVSAGVIGLDTDGRVEMANEAAHTILGVDRPLTGGTLIDVAPEAVQVFEKASASVAGSALSQVEVTTGGEVRELLIRVSARSSRDIGEGYVMTIDDLTALVSAQREAAWGDVARRIAHEIKNPLTPIQLSAERLKRKFGKLAGEDAEGLNRYADVIVRQAGDIRRMVDEFSRFARMPQPEVESGDVVEIVRDAVLLQRAARDDVTFTLAGDDAPAPLHLDKGMISQALTNLLKNACEAIDARVEDDPDRKGEVRVRIAVSDVVEISISDNGVGLPGAERARLTEPYVTTRQKGTGLGLAIVKKIAEQHRGAFSLDDAEPFEDGAKPGAKVTLTLPAGPHGADDADKEENTKI